MASLQPKSKSFGFYVRYGFILAGGCPSLKQERLFSKLSLIDDSVLILDDILDNSSSRNGTLCLHRTHGIQHATIVAQQYQSRAYDYLHALMLECKTKELFQIKILEKFSEFIQQVNKGQKIDLELSKIKGYTPQLLSKYFFMIKTFTGGHIKYALEIGQLLANKNTDQKLSKEAESAGIIRQIIDDFYDYFDAHHEPFGDLTSGANRLPEILFKKRKGNINLALEHVKNKKYSEARKIILNTQIRKEIYFYCKREDKKIHSKLRPLTEDYDKILNFTKSN